LIEYDILYVDKEGDKQDFVISADSPAKAIEHTLYFCPDARRVVKCTPKPMFND